MSRSAGSARWAALGALLAIAACSHAPALPQTPVGRAQTAIRAAERAGAAREPLAGFHLRLARQQLEQAEEARTEGDEQRAARWLARAEADARLASSRAHESQVRRRNLRARQELEQLRLDERELPSAPAEDRGDP